MPVDEKTLYNAITSHLPGASVALRDLAGDNDHWSATVTSPAFVGKSRIEQHRMVQEAVKHLQIHALSITTRAPQAADSKTT